MTDQQARDLQIECRVEKMVDRLDANYMDGKIDESEYRARMMLIDAWAEDQYAAHA